MDIWDMHFLAYPISNEIKTFTVIVY